jgi:hypothetical protein
MKTIVKSATAGTRARTHNPWVGDCARAVFHRLYLTRAPVISRLSAAFNGSPRTESQTEKGSV